MGERASSRSDIAALKLRFRQISYASGVFFYLGDASKVVDEFLSRSLSLGSRPILASPLAPTAAFPRQSALRSRRPPLDFPPNSLPPWLLMRIAREDQGAPQELPKTPRRSASPPPYAKPPSILESTA